jgi:hypothetical protein
MIVLDQMDILLADVLEKGRTPLHWVMRENDWLAIERQLHENTLQIEDHSVIRPNTYKTVPIRFGNPLGDEPVSLVYEGVPPDEP